MWSKYLTQGSEEQQEFPNRAGDGPQITCAQSEHTAYPCRKGATWSCKRNWVGFEMKFHFIKLQCFSGSHSQPHRSYPKQPCVLLLGKLWNVLSYSALSLTTKSPSSLTNICYYLIFNLPPTFPAEQEQIYIFPAQLWHSCAVIYFLSLCSQDS